MLCFGRIPNIWQFMKNLGQKDPEKHFVLLESIFQNSAPNILIWVEIKRFFLKKKPFESWLWKDLMRRGKWEIKYLAFMNIVINPPLITLYFKQYILNNIPHSNGVSVTSFSIWKASFYMPVFFTSFLSIRGSPIFDPTVLNVYSLVYQCGVTCFPFGLLIYILLVMLHVWLLSCTRPNLLCYKIKQPTIGPAKGHLDWNLLGTQVKNCI